MPVGDSSAVAKPGSPMVWSSTRRGGDRRFFSTWSALGNPVFRKLWIAAVISGTCVDAHDTAAMWMMNMLTPSPFSISLLSTVASLPFFLFTLPAGALADMVDRKKLLCSGIIGPALGGLLVPLIGPNSVFAVNAACFLVVILAVLQWKRTTGQSKTGLESFFVSFVTAIRYVRYAPGLQIILARNALFALFISVIPALMPVVGLTALHLNPSQLGLLLTSMGVGSVAGAVFIIPWLRARYSPNTLVVSANLLVVLVYVLMALVRQNELSLIVAALAGVGWALSASELWVAAQRSMPGWARGRMNATVIMVSQLATS